MMKIALAFGLLLQSVAWSAEAPASFVVEWNKQLLAAAEAEDGFMTLKGVRTAAMMHLAMHDALSAIHHQYAPYALQADAPDADPIFAASQAAYEIALSQYPKQSVQWQMLLASTAHASGAAWQRSVELGKAAATAVLDSRNFLGLGMQSFAGTLVCFSSLRCRKCVKRRLAAASYAFE